MTEDKAFAACDMRYPDIDRFESSGRMWQEDIGTQDTLAAARRALDAALARPR